MNFSLLCFVLAVFTISLRRIITLLRRRAVANLHGCKPIVKHPQSGFFSREYDREYKRSFRDGRINEFALEQYRKVGSSTYQIKTFQEQLIHTRESMNHHAMTSQLNNWKREERKGGIPFTGYGIVNQNGLAWRRTRDMVNPLFKRAEGNDLVYFKRHVDRLIALIPTKATFDIQPLIRKLFLDSSTEFIFGESINSLVDTTGEADDLIATFNRGFAEAGRRVRPTGLIARWYALGTWNKKWLADCRKVHDFIDARIAHHKALQNQVVAVQNRYVLIEGMAEAIGDPVELRFQLLGIFTSAQETSAMAFTNVLFLLARNPNIWQQLRAQVLKLKEAQITNLSHEDLNTLMLFRHTVLETFRLHTPIPRNRRIAACDTILPRGGGPDGSAPALIPKDTLVWFDSYPNSRDPKIWGDDVETFRPSRFEGKRFTNWEFTPFSGGPRMCPASQQIITQCVYLLVRLTREFEMIENRDPCQDFVEGVLMCLESRNGCKIALRPSQDI